MRFCGNSRRFGGLCLINSLILGIPPEFISFLLFGFNIENGLGGNGIFLLFAFLSLTRLRNLPRWLRRWELSDLNGWELDHIITLLVIRVLFVVRVLMIFDFGLLFENNIGRSLEEIRFRVLLIANADIHLSLILDNFFFKDIIETVTMIVLLQKLILNDCDLGLLGVTLDASLLARFRLFSIMDDAWRAWSKVTRETLITA